MLLEAAAWEAPLKGISKFRSTGGNVEVLDGKSRCCGHKGLGKASPNALSVLITPGSERGAWIELWIVWYTNHLSKILPFPVLPVDIVSRNFLGRVCELFPNGDRGRSSGCDWYKSPGSLHSALCPCQGLGRGIGTV